MDSATIRSIAQHLHDAEMERREVTRITVEYPHLSVEEAYLVQEELVSIKEALGHRVISLKMGLTSQAKMKQMNVEEPIYGCIFDYMNVPNGARISLGELIHPKVEAEIAFVLGRDVEGPGVTGAQVLAATEYVFPALEIIDSRYENFRFTLPDVIADNASSSRVVFGDRMTRPEDVELDLVGVTLTINGELKELGAGAAVLGHPAHSVAVLANMLSRKGKRLKAGEVVLAGAITGAVMLSRGDVVTAKWGDLGDCFFTVAQ